MPRALRIEVPGGIYHINTKATHGGVVVQDNSDRARWLQLLGFVVEASSWDCLMYCLLGNHYHLVIRINERTMARGMQYLNSRHAQSFNHRYGRHGHLFGARYHSELVETASHALEVSRYVPLNAVRAGLCRSPEEWRWSSLPATLGLTRGPPWLKPDWVLGLFSTDAAVARKRYRRFLADGLAANSQPPSTGSDPTARRQRGLSGRGSSRR